VCRKSSGGSHFCFCWSQKLVLFGPSSVILVCSRGTNPCLHRKQGRYDACTCSKDIFLPKIRSECLANSPGAHSSIS